MNPCSGRRFDRRRGHPHRMILRDHDVADAGTFGGAQNCPKVARVGYAIDEQEWIGPGLEHVLELGIGIFAHHGGDPLMSRVAPAVARDLGLLGEGDLPTSDAHRIHLFFEALAVTGANVERADTARRSSNELANRLDAEYQVGARGLVMLGMPRGMAGRLLIAIGLARMWRRAPAVVAPLGSATVVAKPRASSVTAIFHCGKMLSEKSSSQRHRGGGFPVLVASP